MLYHLSQFIIHWGVTALALWVASQVFHGLTFTSRQSLFVAALLLGFANAIIRPVFIFFTLPLTLITFGFFLLVINALMVMLVAALVPGFKVSGFWTAFFVSIFVAIFSFFIGLFLFQSGSDSLVMPMHQGVLI